MHRLDLAISTHITNELIGTAKDVTRLSDSAEDKYRLAVLYLARSIEHKSEAARIEQGLDYLKDAAISGHKRTKAYFFRVSTALGFASSFVFREKMLFWLPETAEGGYFQSFKDLNEYGLSLMSVDAGTVVSRKYSEVGSQAYDDSWYCLYHKFQDKTPMKDYARRALPCTLCLMSNGNNLLHLAARRGLRRALSRILGDNSGSIDSGNLRGETALLLACRSGHYFVAMEPLEAGVDSGKCSNYREVPLHWHISFDNRLEEICRKLAVNLDAVAEEWNSIDFGENTYIQGTPLTHAFSKNRLDVVPILLQFGADPTSVVGTSLLKGLRRSWTIHRYSNLTSQNLSRGTSGRSGKHEVHAHQRHLRVLTNF